MNGRAYDYNLGRFLSVDPFIQAPGNSQSMNPYSYIMNNPLSGTDPSGYKSICDRKVNCETIWVNGSGKHLVGTIEDKNGKTHNVVIKTNVNVDTEDLESISARDVESITISGENEVSHWQVSHVSGGTESQSHKSRSFEMASVGPGALFDLYNVIESMTDIDARKMKEDIDNAYIQGRDEGAQDFTKWSKFWALISVNGFISKTKFNGLVSRQQAHIRECDCKDVQPYNRDIADYYHFLAVDYYTKLYQFEVARRLPSELKGIMIDTYAIGFVQSRLIDIVGSLGRKSDVEKELLDMQVELMRSIKNQSDRNIQKQSTRYY